MFSPATSRAGSFQDRPVVSLEVQGFWIPDDTAPGAGWARGYLWLHIALGWGLSLLAVAGFSGLIRIDSTT